MFTLKTEIISDIIDKIRNIHGPALIDQPSDAI